MWWPKGHLGRRLLRVERLILVIALISGASSAQADLCDLDPASSRLADSSHSFFASSRPSAAAVDVDPPLWPSALPGIAGAGVAVGSSEVPDRVVLELPSGPGSLGLCLSALLSLGGWQLGRSAKQLHLSNLPDWYHSGGPQQIGHAVPYDFDLGGGAPCILQPACADVRRRGSFRRFARDSQPRGHGQQLALLVTTPRGPPLPLPV